jgi:hypothetical protein
MGWEKRGNNFYYTTSRRENGKVVREYHGRGHIADVIANADDYLRQQKKAIRNALKEQEQTDADAGSLLYEYCKYVDKLMAEELEKAGYYRHHRGEWRRRRIAKGAEKETTDRPCKS